MVDWAIEVCEMNSNVTASTIEKNNSCCCDEFVGTDCCTTSYIYYYTPKFIEEERSFDLSDSNNFTFANVRCTVNKYLQINRSAEQEYWIRLPKRRCNSVSFLLQEENCVWTI